MIDGYFMIKSGVILFLFIQALKQEIGAPPPNTLTQHRDCIFIIIFHIHQDQSLFIIKDSPSCILLSFAYQPI